MYTPARMALRNPPKPLPSVAQILQNPTPAYWHRIWAHCKSIPLLSQIHIKGALDSQRPSIYHVMVVEGSFNWQLYYRPQSRKIMYLVGSVRPSTLSRLKRFVWPHGSNKQKQTEIFNQVRGPSNNYVMILYLFLFLFLFLTLPRSCTGCSGANDISCAVGGNVQCLRNKKCNGIQDECDGNLDETSCSGELWKGTITDRAPCSLRWVVHKSMLFNSPHSSLS